MMLRTHIFWIFAYYAYLFKIEFSSGHVLNYDSVTVCDGVSKQIQCPHNENIHVLQGFYGKWRNHDCKGEHPDPDNTPTCSINRKRTTSIARDLCQGKNTCKLSADKAIHGEPCPNNKAYLYVTFFCLAQGHKLKHHKTPTNQEVVTVPSHGFVTQESNMDLEEAKQKKRKEVEENKKAKLPPKNPTPEDKSRNLENKVEDIEDKKLISQSDKPIKEGVVSQKSSLPVTSDNVSEKSSLPMMTSSDISEKSSLPIASDVSKTEEINEKEVRSSTICNGQSKLIACLPEEGINVLNSFYGKKSGEDCKGELPYKDEAPTCSALDAKSNVQSSCNGKQTCLLFADENIYGKSLCPNVNKYLHIKYSCIPQISDIPSTQMKLTPQEDLEEDAVSRSSQPVVEKQNTTVKICNGERRTVSCKGDTGMTILSAFYGKRSGKDCRGDLGYRDDIPECDNPRALDSIKFLCENRKSCELASENELFGDDVCSGVNKYLEVTYGC